MTASHLNCVTVGSLPCVHLIGAESQLRVADDVGCYVMLVRRLGESRGDEYEMNGVAEIRG